MAPIKRHTALIPLSKQHHEGLLFCWKLRQGLLFKIEATRITQFINWFWNHHLQPHFLEEEQFLFQQPNLSLVKQALEEHEGIRAVIRLANLRNLEPNETLQLATLIDHHIRFEERILFPALEQEMTQEALEAVQSKLGTHTHSHLLPFSDAFWLQKKNDRIGNNPVQ